MINETAVLAGNYGMMEEKNITVTDALLAKTGEFLKQGCTVIYVSADDKRAGSLVLSDTPRENCAAMIA